MSAVVLALVCVYTAMLLCIYGLWRRRRRVRSAACTPGPATPPQERVDSGQGSGGSSRNHTVVEDVPTQGNAAYGSVGESRPLYLNLHSSTTEDTIYDVPRFVA